MQHRVQRTNCTDGRGFRSTEIAFSGTVRMHCSTQQPTHNKPGGRRPHTGASTTTGVHEQNAETQSGTPEKRTRRFNPCCSTWDAVHVNHNRFGCTIATGERGTAAGTAAANDAAAGNVAAVAAAAAADNADTAVTGTTQTTTDVDGGMTQVRCYLFHVTPAHHHRRESPQQHVRVTAGPGAGGGGGAGRRAMAAASAIHG